MFHHRFGNLLIYAKAYRMEQGKKGLNGKR